MDLPVSSSTTAKLRETYDTIEMHLRSLKALSENVDQPNFAFVIKSKLPKIEMARIDEFKDMEEKWTVESIWKAFKRYICALRKLDADKLNRPGVLELKKLQRGFLSRNCSLQNGLG